MNDHDGKDIPSNGMRKQGEQDRTQEYKDTRDNLVTSIGSLLDTVAELQSRNETLNGSEIINEPGISRSVIDDPSADAKFNMLTEKIRPPGVYFHIDEKTGDRTLVIIDEKSKVTEIVDSPQELMVSGPVEGYSGSGSSQLASFTETLPDRSYISSNVISSGGLYVDTFDGNSHSSTAPKDAGQLQLIETVWSQIEADVLPS
ncbi:MAG: hypothetical protein NTV95_02160 [Candidatus Saccharibacteria bacterium]|nr:hypothetical protein [Candidatus Saccharibacteria bacterium]